MEHARGDERRRKTGHKYPPSAPRKVDWVCGRTLHHPKRGVVPEALRWLAWSKCLPAQRFLLTVKRSFNEVRAACNTAEFVAKKR